MDRSIFLTGGTGFFGKSILSCVQRGMVSGYRFTILSRSPEDFLRSNPEFSGMAGVAFHKGDVRDFEFPKRHYDLVLHAGTPALRMADGEQRDIILRGTERVLSFTRECGATRLMFVSSGGAYGIQPPDLERLPENWPCHPCTEYGIAKLEAEGMCLASGVDCVIPRCFAFTGVYLNRNIHFAIGNFIRDALQGAPIVITGDGTTYRSYLHADDLVEWLFALLERGRNGGVYNVGSDQAVCFAELAETVRDVLESKSEIQIMGTPVPGAKAARYIPDVSKICGELGVRIKKDLREAIRASVR